MTAADRAPALPGAEAGFGLLLAFCMGVLFAVVAQAVLS